MIGAIVASAILDGLTPGRLEAGVTLTSGTSIAQGLFIEMFATAILTISVLMLAAGMSTTYIFGILVDD
jgi:aquaporin related protein